MAKRPQIGDRPGHARCGEQGYLLLGLLFIAALILIGLAIAAPKIAKQIQREKEIETVHRGEQYKRAIQLYYRKFGRYPTSIAQLKETNQIRFLRQDYIDPMTGKKDWKLLHLGQVQMVTLGFFGKVMTAGGAMPVAGATGAANGAMPGASGVGANGLVGTSGDSFSGSAGFGQNPTLAGSGPDGASNGNDNFFSSSSEATTGGSTGANADSNGTANGSTGAPSDSAGSAAESNGANAGSNGAQSNADSSDEKSSESVYAQSDQNSTDGSFGGGSSGFGNSGLSSNTSMNNGPGGISSGGMNSGGNVRLQ